MKPKINLKPHMHEELPLHKEGANVFLKIMTAVSVFVFTLMFSAFLVLDGVAQNWREGMDNTLTVQMMPSEEALPKKEEDARRQKVLAFFENLDSVESVRLIPDEEMQKLMSPWLGAKADLSVLPLPALLDVKLKAEASPDFEAMAAELAETAPYATFDNHRLWLGRLVKFASVLRLLALIVLLMVLTVSALSIFYAVCTSLGVHREIISILHIMGAKDNYIAAQYARRSFDIGFGAGLVGMLLGVSGILGISRVASVLNTALLGNLSLDTLDWFFIATLPLWSALLSMITAWLSVKRTLRKMV